MHFTRQNSQRLLQRQMLRRALDESDSLWQGPCGHRDERRVHHRGNKVEPSYRTGERNLAINFDVLPLIRDLYEKEIGLITREA
jgi:hypothetical protein